MTTLYTSSWNCRCTATCENVNKKLCYRKETARCRVLAIFQRKIKLAYSISLELASCVWWTLLMMNSHESPSDEPFFLEGIQTNIQTDGPTDGRTEAYAAYSESVSK